MRVVRPPCLVCEGNTERLLVDHQEFVNKKPLSTQLTRKGPDPDNARAFEWMSCGQHEAIGRWKDGEGAACGRPMSCLFLLPYFWEEGNE